MDQTAREQVEASRFIKDLEDGIASSVPESDPLTARLLLVFWALSL